MSGGCCVYAIAGRHARGEAGRDLHLPSPVFGSINLVVCRELVAVTEPMADDETPLTTDAVLRHEAIVEAVRREAPALPVRFGTMFRDTTSVVSALSERYESLVADLDRLGDKVELSLTALFPAPARDAVPSCEPAPPGFNDAGAPEGRGAGARYLFARAAEIRRRDASRERARAMSRELDHLLGPLSLERRVSLLPSPRIALRAVYLLDPAAVDDFRIAFDGVRQARGEMRLVLTGPWPPYTFVQRAGGESGIDPASRLTTLARGLTGTMLERLG